MSEAGKALPPEAGVAIVGVAGRFPGARNVDEFWRNISDGVESISFFTDRELLESGVDSRLLRNPRYVKAAAVLDGIDLFDADFFDIKPTEAKVMDPQHRVFLETAWEALENAGYTPERYSGVIGIFAGSNATDYLSRVREDATLLEGLGSFYSQLANEKDFLTTRVSYKLNLTGPSIAIQTACSTSLVAVHLACQSLLNGECDMALAGGVGLALGPSGHLYEEGGVGSPDGHCRPFDSEAQGTVNGSGVGIVVLKSLHLALRDRDFIYAVIRGSAVNNDGRAKVSYTAPSLEGQARSVTEALGVAGIDPDTIGYVEAHGTATPLGDPIEVAALTEAFRPNTPRRGYCALGSVKANIGHLNAAAGVAGLIKAVLAIQKSLIPPSRYFRSPNPKLDLEQSPFFVNTQGLPWLATGVPRRALVSSLGIGGTNAHVVLEEARAHQPSGPSRPWQALPLSAKSSGALENMSLNLLRYLDETPELNLPDVAHTLQVGRASFNNRRVVVCRDRDEARTALKELDSRVVFTGLADGEAPSVAFLFPGVGSQFVNMARELYFAERVFRAEVDKCFELLRHRVGFDLKEILYPCPEPNKQSTESIDGAGIAHPALFVIEYCLAKLWMSLGVRPDVLLGHSLGEFTAAAIAGVFRPEDALRLVVARGRLMDSVPRGAMLAVPLSEREIRRFVDGAVGIASVNSPDSCVISGPAEAILEVQARLRRESIESRRLNFSHACHSAMLDPIIAEFTEEVRSVPLHPPQIPFVSSLSGTWIQDTEATDPAYWGRHLRQTVRLADGLREILSRTDQILIEMGPGRVLSTLAGRQGAGFGDCLVLNTLCSEKEAATDVQSLAAGLGRCWVRGVAVDWEAFGVDEDRHRTPLPTYPFERRRYWIERIDSQKSRSHQERPALDSTNEAGKVTTLRERSHPDIEREQLVCEKNIAFRPTGPRPGGYSADGISGEQEKIRVSIERIVGDLLGHDAARLRGSSSSFLELGADSLMLMRVCRAVEEEFGVTISHHQLMTALCTIDDLAAFLHSKSQRETLPVPDVASHSRRESTDIPAPRVGDAAPGTHPVSGDLESHAESSRSDPLLEEVVFKQLDIMSTQLNLLRTTRSVASHGQRLRISESSNGHDQEIKRTISPEHIFKTPEETAAFPQFVRTVRRERGMEPAVDNFGPFRPVRKQSASELTPQQSDYLAAFIGEYTRKTQESKQQAATSRNSLADPRMSTGFQLAWKEMVYPVVVQRSRGSKLWDIDGNEYIDFTMGFGVHLFGHSPAFLVDALQKQLAKGIHIGPQCELVGRVAQMMTNLTGMDRVAFCNSGTEAIMACLRLARAASGRTKVAIFEGSYHGTFDGVLARPRKLHGFRDIVPVAPGTCPNFVADLIVLSYGDPESLNIIREQSSDLAAVLVEPVQSSNLDLQPKTFLADLRELTERSHIALIFDEIISGFRAHPGGAQGWFGVKGDLAAYGKVLGGGTPIGVVAGSAEYMDAVDGGRWDFGDASSPTVPQVVFAGTFSKNPLAMAAAEAILGALQNQSPQLQRDLNSSTTRLVQSLANLFEEQRVPMTVSHFGSQFRFSRQPGGRWLDLLFHHAVKRGLYIWEGRSCFLSTSHTQDDIDKFVAVISSCLEDLRKGGFLPELSVPMRFPADSSPAVARASQVENDPLTEPKQDGTPPAQRVGATAAMRRLWVHSQVSRASSLAYNELVALRILGDFDIAALNHALRLLVGRHDALRTSFTSDGEHLKIASGLDIPVSSIDACEMYSGNRETSVTAILDQEAEERFDLTLAPLFRVRMYKLEAAHHLFVLIFHHAIMDGFSANIFVRELREFYNAATQGRTHNASPAMQLNDFIRRLLKSEESHAMAEAKTYWLEHLSGATGIRLPATKPRPRLSLGGPGGRERLEIRGSIHTAAKSFATESNCTLFTVLLGVFCVLLHRWSQQEDVTIGIPSLTRSFHNAEHMLAHTVDLLPIRSRLAGNPTFRQYLASIRQLLLDAYQHSTFGYSNLLETFSASAKAQSPLIATTFNLEPHFDSLGSTLMFGRAEIQPVSCPIHYVKFDLHWNITESAGALHLTCEYDSSLFESATIRQMASAYQNLLAEVLAEPDRPISMLPLLSREELEQSVVEWNRTGTEYPREKCVHEVFEEQVERAPAVVAVMQGERQITYGDLNGRANQLAHHLRGLGVGAEVVVGICLERSIEMVVALLGILKAGGVYLPLDPDYPEERLKYMLKESGAVAVVTTAELRGAVPCSGIAMVCVDGDDSKGIAQQLVKNPVSLTTADNAAYVVYTSGSTGVPKGICIPHRGVNRLVINTNYVDLDGKDVVAQISTLAFDAAAFEIWGALLNGSRLVIFRKEQVLAEGFADELEKRGITTLFLITSLFNHVSQQNGGAFRSIRQVLFGGEAVDPQWVKSVMGSERPQRLLHMYGPAEGTTLSTFHEVGTEDGESHTVPIGRGVANTQVYVLDGEMQPVPMGVIGELYIGGEGLARGYVNRPDVTGEKFVPDPFGPAMGGRLYRTGDLVKWQARGALEFIGRRDHQVKIRGYRIEPGEIEAILEQHPAVAHAVVIAREGESTGKRLVAYIVTTSGSEVGVAELRGHLQACLPEYMLPRAYVFLSSVPLTKNGKTDREALPDPDPATQTLEAYAAPQSATEQTVAVLWTQMLGIERVSAHDNFFDLGGDSLKATRLVASFRGAFGVDMEIAAVFENPTLAKLSENIDALARTQQGLPAQTL